MADKKISELDVASTLAGTEVLPIVQGGVTKKISADNLVGSRSNTFTSAQVIEATDNSKAALRVTQLGTGEALRVEDSTNPDSTPFVVTGSGDVGVGTAAPDALLTVNGIASFGAGAAATPSLAATGDLNTGVFFPAADTVAISTGGSERVRVNSSGSVGLAGANFGTSGQAMISGGNAASPSWGTLGVSGGGTGATTLTGLVKGNGTSAFTAAVAGTDYLAPAAIGTTVQAYDSDLATLAGLTPGLDSFIVGSGTAWTTESGATARTSLGLGTTDSPQFTGIELGNATDTTITRSAAGVLAVEGGIIPKENRANTFSAAQVISLTDNTNAGLRITQLGTGNALLVEDSTNPDATPFVVDASGRVINGHTASVDVAALTNGAAQGPTQQIVSTTQSGTQQSQLFFGTAAAVAPTVVLGRSNSTTVGSHTIVAAEDRIGAYCFQASDGAQFIRAASIEAFVDGTPGLNDMPTRLVFRTTADGALVSTDRVRIDSAGYTQQLTAPILPYQGAPTTKAAAATLTGAELVTGILNTTGTTYTITLPTAASIEAALVWGGNNVCLDWYVINTASGTITIAPNSNTTLGLLTINTNTSAYFRIRRTGASAFTVYRMV